LANLWIYKLIVICDVAKLQKYQLRRHFGEIIKLGYLKYVIKITSQIFKPLLSKILVALLYPAINSWKFSWGIESLS